MRFIEMSKQKSFDCVKMKDELQAKVRERYAGLSDEEILARSREWLETSNDPLVQKWRRLKELNASG